MRMADGWRVSAAAATSGRGVESSNPVVLAGDVALLSCRAAGKAGAPSGSLGLISLLTTVKGLPS
jgi:hypothetical protein